MLPICLLLNWANYFTMMLLCDMTLLCRCVSHSIFTWTGVRRIFHIITTCWVNLFDFSWVNSPVNWKRTKQIKPVLTVSNNRENWQWFQTTNRNLLRRTVKRINIITKDTQWRLDQTLFLLQSYFYKEKHFTTNQCS